MIGVNSGLLALLHADVNFQQFTSHHCIIQCASRLGYSDILQSVLGIVKFIRASSLRHHQFQEFIKNMGTEFADITYHKQVRWLSRGNVFRRVFSLYVELLAFVHYHNREHSQLCDIVWFAKLAFLADANKHLKDLNLKLHGQQKLISVMAMTFEAFKSNLQLFRTQPQAMNWAHFPCVGELWRMTMLI